MKQGSIMIDALLADAPGELILVRHGQQGNNQLNDPLRPYGGDVALSELGVRQALATAETLAGEPIEAVYTSPLLRASGTSAAIAAAHGLDPRVDPDLVEVDGYRDLPPGKTVLDVLGESGVSEMRRRFIAERRWDVLSLSEPAEEFRRRVAAAIARIEASHPPESRVAVVCHSGVINAVVAAVLGMTTDLVSFVSHASITRIARGEGRSAVRAVNQDQHLRDRGLQTY